MIGQLFMQSAGVGVGTFLGVILGLLVRRRGGKTDMLFRESILATAFLAAAVATFAMMVINFLRMG